MCVTSYEFLIVSEERLTVELIYVADYVSVCSLLNCAVLVRFVPDAC